MQNAECRVQNGGGCVGCPVNPCQTLTYRGSTCTAQRARFGLGDPLTNADWIRAMSDEELCDFIMDAPAIPCDEKISAMMKENGCNDCEKCVMDWLRQPAKEEST